MRRDDMSCDVLYLVVVLSRYHKKMDGRYKRGVGGRKKFQTTGMSAESNK